MSENDIKDKLRQEENEPDNDEGVEVEFETGEDEESSEQPVQNDNGSEKNSDNDDDGEKPKRKSRAQERIRELNAKYRKEQEERERMASEMEELRKKLKETETRSKSSERKYIEDSLSSIDDSINTMKAQIRQARENGDYDTDTDLSVALQEKLVQKQILQAKKQKFESESVSEDTPQKAETSQKQTTNNQLPEATRSWVQKNDWFLYPSSPEEEFKRNRTIRLGTTLEQEGYDPRDEDYYEELDRRLAQQGSDVVEYDEDATEKAKTPSESGTKASDSSQNTRKQPVVSGGSRNPQQSSGGAGKKSTRVRLTAEQRKMAHSMLNTLPPEEAERRYAQVLRDRGLA